MALCPANVTEGPWMDEREDTGGIPHRRSDDPEGQFVRTVKAADFGIALVWRWVIILGIVIGFGMTIQTIISRGEASVKSIDDFKAEIRSRLDLISKDTTSNSGEVRDLRMQLQQLREQLKERSDSQAMADSRIIVLEKSYSRLEGRLSK